MRVLTQIILVALGSSAGGLSRWGLTTLAAKVLGTAFPWGTLIINVFGSLFLGWFMSVLSDRLPSAGHGWLRPDDLRLMVAVGFTGAFTTFSTFEYESDRLLRDGEWLSGTTYMVGSLLLGLVAIRLGTLLAR